MTCLHCKRPLSEGIFELVSEVSERVVRRVCSVRCADSWKSDPWDWTRYEWRHVQAVREPVAAG